jgi:signal transduction histidine kinase
MLLAQTVLAIGLLATHLYYTRRRLQLTLDEGIRAHAMSVAALVRYEEDRSGDVYFDDSLLPQSLDPAHPDLFTVWADRSGLLTRSENWPDALDIPPQGEAQWDFTWNGVTYRAMRATHVPVLDREVGANFRPQTLTIVYAAPMLAIQSQTRHAAEFITIGSIILLAVTLPLALWGIRRGLDPLNQLAAQAAQVSVKNWEFRPPGAASQTEELIPLTNAMTTMVERLRQSFLLQGQFLGNAAHELKTPVAILKSTLQSLLYRERSPAEYRKGLEGSLEDLGRLEQLLQYMLRLARAEQWAIGPQGRELPAVDIGATCQNVIERLRSLADSRHMRIELSANGPVMFRADPEDLQLVWTNLLENAVRYSNPGSSVEVMVSRNNGGPAQVEFHDHGPGIPAEELPHIFERFYRGDPSRTRSTGGFGLGLAIAKALVEAYGGTIRAESDPGQGTRMKVELPD